MRHAGFSWGGRGSGACIRRKNWICINNPCHLHIDLCFFPSPHHVLLKLRYLWINPATTWAVSSLFYWWRHWSLKRVCVLLTLTQLTLVTELGSLLPKTCVLSWCWNNLSAKSAIMECPPWRDFFPLCHSLSLGSVLRCGPFARIEKLCRHGRWRPHGPFQGVFPLTSTNCRETQPWLPSMCTSSNF